MKERCRLAVNCAFDFLVLTVTAFIVVGSSAKRLVARYLDDSQNVCVIGVTLKKRYETRLKQTVEVCNVLLISDLLYTVLRNTQNLCVSVLHSCLNVPVSRL